MFCKNARILLINIRFAGLRSSEINCDYLSHMIKLIKCTTVHKACQKRCGASAPHLKLQALLAPSQLLRNDRCYVPFFVCCEDAFVIILF